MTDLYDILGCGKTASPAELKAAYRAKARHTHPDAGGNAEDFKQVENAYRILKDPDERAYYDQHGKAKDAKPTVESVAVDILAQLTEQFLDRYSGSLNSRDLVQEFRGMLVEVVHSHKRTMKHIKSSNDDLVKAISRLTKTAEAKDTFIGLLSNKVEKNKPIIEKMEFEAEALKIAIGLLDGYDFMPEVDPKRERYQVSDGMIDFFRMTKEQPWNGGSQT